MAKTIDDYQPDILIREAVSYIADPMQASRSGLYLIETLVANDMGRQMIDATHEDIGVWTRRAITAARI